MHIKVAVVAAQYRDLAGPDATVTAACRGNPKDREPSDARPYSKPRCGTIEKLGSPDNAELRRGAYITQTTSPTKV